MHSKRSASPYVIARIMAFYDLFLFSCGHCVSPPWPNSPMRRGGNGDISMSLPTANNEQVIVEVSPEPGKDSLHCSGRNHRDRASVVLSTISRSETKWLLLLLLIMVLFYWKILLTRQFSLLTDFESTNQTYSWFHFWVASLRQGVAPVWDPFVFSGRSFSGEMQTGAFYPLNLFVALLPLNRQGLLSPQMYQWFFVLA